MRKILFTICIFCVTMTQAVAQNSYTSHEIKTGETLYSIARTYGISVKDIQTANPGLGDYYQIGQTILIPGKVEIPDCRTTYVVQKKETIYGISRKFGLTEEELLAANTLLKDGKLKKNTELCIPYSQAQKDSIIALHRPKVIRPTEVNVGVVLPFGLNQEKKSKEAATMTDLYEGIMMAVQELKTKGLSINIHAYDEDRIDDIFMNPEMKKMNIIIGPKDAFEITRMTRFCETNNIHLVIPLSSQETIVNGNKNVFQINTKIESRYARVFEQIGLHYPSYNIVYVNFPDGNNQYEFMSKHIGYLAQQHQGFLSVNLDNLTPAKQLLDEGKRVLIIPGSSTVTAFEQLTDSLSAKGMASANITLFGYTDWQAFASKYIDRFSRFNATFFTSFFNNPGTDASMAFNQRFYDNFQRNQYNTYPRFGMLGYDIANFFIKSIWEQGNMFTSNLEQLKSSSLQNPMHFTRKDAKSGFINTALMFVRYNGDGSISIKQF